MGRFWRSVGNSELMMGEENQVQDLEAHVVSVLSLLWGHGSDSVGEHLPSMHAKPWISSVPPPPPPHTHIHTNKTKGEETKQQIQGTGECPAGVGGERQGLEEVRGELPQLKSLNWRKEVGFSPERALN